MLNAGQNERLGKKTTLHPTHTTNNTSTPQQT